MTCGETITRDTRLDSDLIDCEGVGLVIGAGAIALDLNGHAVDGTHGQQLFPGPAGIDNSEGHDAFELRGPGTIRDFDSGVALFNASDNLLHGFEASENLVGISLHGFLATGNVITRSVVTDNFFAGIRMGDYCAANVAAGNNRVERNAAFENGDDGIVLSGCGDGNVISKNTAFENFRGIDLSDSFGHTVIERNYVSRNIYTGIDSGELQNSRIEQNKVTANGQDGIAVTDQNNLIRKNVASENGDDGIDVVSENTVLHNTANHNGDLGIEAEPGVTDGGGNRAFGNANPLECVYVECK